MKNPATPPDPIGMLNQKLAQELCTMRDALVKLALCLQDWRFEMDPQSRQQAQQETDAMLRALQHKPAPSRDPGAS